ncbi:hypothetical protein BT67DRAFT_462340, partial [Trichocladium antarcticum]
MSEAQSRPVASRGRGSGRGGRGGGFATRGGVRAGTRTNGDSKHDTETTLPAPEDEGEIGQLKKQYGSKVAGIKEMFPDWSEIDILYALQETEGDENLAGDRIAEGIISQWGEVSKPRKERTRLKGKPETFTTTTGDSTPAGLPRNARGGRGADTGRGRGRGGAVRGKSIPATLNGARNKETQPLSIPTEESSEWNTKPAEESAAWGEPTATETTPAAPEAAPTNEIVTSKPATMTQGAKTTWASMLRQATVPKAAPKPKEAPIKAPEAVIDPLPPVEPTASAEEEAPAPVEEPTPEPVNETAPAAPVEPVVPAVPAVPIVPTVVVPEVALLPSKDLLTETNLDKVADDSHPPQTETAISECADSWDPSCAALSSTATPLSASQQQHQANRTPTTSKATARTPLHPRRMLDQLEAVRMPGNRDQVDRAAVQFGAFSLNGPIDDDVDGDREEPETRPQPPEDSPVTHPRTSLPPAQPTPVPEAFPAQKPAAAQIPTGPAAAAPSAPQAIPPTAPQAATQPPATQTNQQFGRFGQTASQEPASYPTTKPFEPFGQQQPATSGPQSQFDAGFQGQGQAAQVQSQQQPGGPFSSAPSDYSSYYTADQQNRYNNYYNQNFAQQQSAQGQESLSSQPQRSFSGYNAPQTDNLSQYPQSGSQHGQSRFGSTTGTDAQITATPAPGATTAQAQAGPAAQAQSHGQQQPHDYPYSSHPYYTNPYYSAYMNYQGGYNQAGYGGGPYGKAGYQQQPSQYGVSPQGPHGYSSPAAAFGQSTLHRDSGAAAGLGDYGRAGSAQSGQAGLGGFGGAHDTFGRGASAYQSQAGQSFAPGSQPGGVPSAADDLKPFGEAKATGGPS